ncbi:methyltransferase domain-containing protein [Mucilaginibacter dorajii]|uniref:Methyltransferase type 11 domain-containing protein n=1 Tax=Mucilaginibacter dorajii TaxID=692994 RepID=A0ABP7QEA0_9SPHI|nr:methyltransferase domain-containing protein [Mucilaginibacter dorajii]MCS3733109.1 ubiquinone/menaquinone biosynthesis C-methylase UbiE [Mucilaginibacter dorajii]
MSNKTYDEAYLNQLQVVLAKTITRSLALLAAKPGETICDIGCGVGDLVFKIAAYGANVIGIDNDENFLTVARKNNLTHTNVKFICSDADHIPLEDNSIDKIIVHRVLQHVIDHESVIKECCRILKPGGTLQIVEPDYLSLTFFLNDIGFERKLIDRVAYNRIPNSYKVRQLPFSLNNAGFNVGLTEVHNYLIDSFELANYVIRFDEEVEKGYACNDFTQLQYEAWQELKKLPQGQFNLSLNLLLVNAIK